jgi:hypothetical protein
MNKYTQLIFISAERENLTELENEQRTLSLIENLDKTGLKYVQCLGCYKGIQEKSFMIMHPLLNGYWLNHFKTLARAYNQESLLYRDSNGLYSLEYSNSLKSEIIGTEKIIDENQIKNHDNYTYIRDTNTYFIVN